MGPAPGTEPGQFRFPPLRDFAFTPGPGAPAGPRGPQCGYRSFPRPVPSGGTSALIARCRDSCGSSVRNGTRGWNMGARLYSARAMASMSQYAAGFPIQAPRAVVFRGELTTPNPSTPLCRRCAHHRFRRNHTGPISRVQAGATLLPHGCIPNTPFRHCCALRRRDRCRYQRM